MRGSSCAAQRSSSARRAKRHTIASPLSDVQWRRAAERTVCDSRTVPQRRATHPLQQLCHTR